MIKTTKNFNQERNFQGQRVGMVNLGCARNLVDSQTILGKMRRSGHRVVDINEADIAIVNTCGFIAQAKQESIDTIVELLELKKQGKLKKVIVAGCLAQRYSEELRTEFKDIDAIIGAQKLDRDIIPEQVTLTPRHFAYVKICESCYNRCSFCIIPKIKGKFVSRTMESIAQEIQKLDAQGVKEINLIGQDITAYGMDLYHEYSLAKLLKKVIPLTKNIQWIRLLYAFPAHVTDELIEVIASEEKICKYIDMPLQHISDHLLSSMNRGISTQGTIDLVEKMRHKIPQGSLRTTFIVGMPGETDQDFSELKSFIEKVRFEKLGVFVYSREEGTAAYDMPGQVAEKIKKNRLDELMQIQQGISKDVQENFLGQTLKVLIEEPVENPVILSAAKDLRDPSATPQDDKSFTYLGRSEFDAPDVDGVVYVHSSRELAAGDFVNVKITETYEYDCAGHLV